MNSNLFQRKNSTNNMISEIKINKSIKSHLLSNLKCNFHNLLCKLSQKLELLKFTTQTRTEIEKMINSNIPPVSKLKLEKK